MSHCDKRVWAALQSADELLARIQKMGPPWLVYWAREIARVRAEIADVEQEGERS